MIQIAVLTPATDDGTYGPHWPQVLERLGAALALADVTPVATPWSDHAEDASGLVGYPLVLGALAWGYHQKHDAWIRALGAWETAGVRLANPPSVLGWNSDKVYLRRLETAGVAIPATAWTDRATQDQVDAAFDRFGTETLIVKPTVSAGAWKTTKVGRGERLIDAPPGPAMIQPFLPELVEAGELSLLFFGGRFSHAVVKTPRAGDFRIQSQYGGRYRTVEPAPAAALALADQVLAAIREPLLYARIDMVQGSDGRWLLMEAELIEPDFYLSEAPDRGLMFARAVRAWLGNRHDGVVET